MNVALALEALLALTVAVSFDGVTAVRPTRNRKVMLAVAPAARVSLIVQVTVEAVCVHPAVVGEPVCSVKPVGTLSVSVVTFAVAFPVLE